MVDIVRSDDGVVRLLPANRQLVPDAVGERQRLRLPEKQKNRKQSQEHRNLFITPHHQGCHRSGCRGAHMCLTRLFTRVLRVFVLAARCLSSSPLKLFICKRVKSNLNIQTLLNESTQNTFFMPTRSLCESFFSSSRRRRGIGERLGV